MGVSWNRGFHRQNRSDEAANCALDEVSSARHSRCSCLMSEIHPTIQQAMLLEDKLLFFSTETSVVTCFFLEILLVICIGYSFEWVRTSKGTNWPGSIEVRICYLLVSKITNRPEPIHVTDRIKTSFVTSWRISLIHVKRREFPSLLGVID